MFSPFFRATNAKIGREGTGLGLFVVKKLAEELGCKVWFDSEENKGTTFYVSIPVNKESVYA